MIKKIKSIFQLYSVIDSWTNLFSRCSFRLWFRRTNGCRIVAWGDSNTGFILPLAIRKSLESSIFRLAFQGRFFMGFLLGFCCWVFVFRFSWGIFACNLNTCHLMAEGQIVVRAILKHFQFSFVWLAILRYGPAHFFFKTIFKTKIKNKK